MSPAGPRAITRPARPDSLAALLGFLDEMIAAAGLDPAAAHDVRLAAEEVCSNVIAHAYPGGTGPLTLRFERRPQSAVVTVEDAGVPFDPASAPGPRFEDEWDVRAEGGLGWHLVRHMVDEIRHEPLAGGGNRVTLVKHLPVSSQGDKRTMDATVEQVGAVALVRITGSVDGLTADSLQATFRQQLEAGVSRVVADLSGVEYTSSAGLRTLLGTMKLARQNGGDLRLAAVQPAVLRVLDLSGFTTILKLYPDAAAAIASFA